MDADDDDRPEGVPVLDTGHGGRLSAALETSLAALDVQPRDQALAALLAAYARELDGADALAARARKVAEDVRREAPDSALDERVAALEAAVSKRSALVQLGARFHAGLAEILGTPKARGVGKAPPEPKAPAVGSPLARLRLASGDE